MFLHVSVSDTKDIKCFFTAWLQIEILTKSVKLQDANL